MKRKQLIKKSRDLPEETLRRIIESGGVSVENHFLVGDDESGYDIGTWDTGGRPTVWMQLDGDEVVDFAKRRYLRAQGVPVYAEEGDIPASRSGGDAGGVFAGE